MTLSLTTRRVEGILVIDMCGKLTIYEDNFREFVRSSLQAGERSIVLRLAELSYLDSAGLGQLVSAYTAFSKAGGDVRLLAPSPRARQLLKMTKLDTVFTIFEDETAIRNFAHGGDPRGQSERGPGTPERSLGAIR
jgi:anti-sigma B factor antagonist